MLVSRRLLLRAAPLAAALGPLAACSSGTASDPHSSVGPAPASLVLDTAAWSHDADNDVYYQLGLSYVTAPQDTAHETLGIFVPGAYLSAVDNKAAVRYLRYNAAGLPGDVERVFVFGHSGGGAQSAVMGASGDSALYTPYLEALGAATAGADGGPLSDAIAGAMCWCPITSLNEANAAYEWNMGQFSSEGARAPGTWTEAYSKDLAAAYAGHVNAMGLTDAAGTALSLEASGTGVYLKGSYYDHLVGVVTDSLNAFLAATEFPYTPDATQMAGMGGGAPGGPDGGAPPRRAVRRTSFPRSRDAPSGSSEGRTTVWAMS